MHLLDKPQSPQPRLSSSRGRMGNEKKNKKKIGSYSPFLPKDDFHTDVKV